MGNEKFDWTKHILNLDDLPNLSEQWTLDLISEFRRWVPKGRKLKIVEIGCSNGRWLRWFRNEYDAETFGVDLDVVKAEDVEHFIFADGLNLPFKDHTFDIVFSLGLVEHFANKTIRRQLFSEHIRIAKDKSGLIFIDHPNMSLSLNMLWTKVHYDFCLKYKHYFIQARETVNHFQHFNVDILQTRWIGWCPPKILQTIRKKLHKVIPIIGEMSPRPWPKKKFEHPLTADDFLIIGQKRGKGSE